MLNQLTKLFFGKEIILYNRHRVTLPLINNLNTNRYIFIYYLPIWRFTRLFGRNGKLRYRIMAFLLTVISPKIILDINWINKLDCLYYVWCKNHQPSKFIVVQHGFYIGGIITDNAHKYAKCDVILCWGEYSKNEFIRYNKSKKLEIINFGNPIYNLYDRSKITYKQTVGSKILIVPTLVKDTRKLKIEQLIRNLIILGFDVYVKEHLYQSKLSEKIKAPKTIIGSLYEILISQEFDIVISDTSTTLIDSLYFKNYTLYFSPVGELPEYTENAYSKYMINISEQFMNFTCKNDILKLIDVQKQEELLKTIQTTGNNQLF